MNIRPSQHHFVAYLLTKVSFFPSIESSSGLTNGILSHNFITKIKKQKKYKNRENEYEEKTNESGIKLELRMAPAYYLAPVRFDSHT